MVEVVAVLGGHSHRLEERLITPVSKFIEKAAEFGRTMKGTVVASDAFLPFADTLEVAAAAGATALIQPGGSIRDAEVLAKADELGIAMVFTGVRHFRH